MHFILALLTMVLPKTEAKAEEALDIPQRMAPSPGFWQATAPERQADELSLACRWAAPQAALAKAQELLAAKHEAQAMQCLDEALQENPRDQDLAAARQRLAPAGKGAVGEGTGARAATPRQAQKGVAQGGHEVNAHGSAPQAESKGQDSGHGGGEPRSGEPGGEHGGHEEEPPYKLGLGYVHAQVGKDDKLTDVQVQAAHHWEHDLVLGVVHVLHKTAKEHEPAESSEAGEAAPAATEEAAALAETEAAASKQERRRDTALDTTWSHGWDKNRLGLLLGYSFGDGKVSYKSTFGLRYERLLPGETTLGAQVRSLKFVDGHATGFDIKVDTHFSSHGIIGGQIAVLAGHYKGSAGTLRLGYEEPGVEIVGFVTKGHGLPSHPYLRPEGTNAFTTYGAEFAKHLAKHWALSLGAERRGESKHRFEVELSGGLAWEG